MAGEKVDYKAMYYHLAGRTAMTVDVLEATTTILDATTKSLDATTKSMEATKDALITITEKLKKAQQDTEEMFMSADEDEE